VIRFLFIAQLVCLSIRAQGILSPSQIREIEALISVEMSKQHIPGMSIAISTRDGSVWSNGYGMADLENFVPAKASTVFRTASIAKPITAVAALQLAQAGVLDLDAPIDRYIPEFPKKSWPVTTRQLLGHLGGIRHYKDDLEAYVTKHYASLSEAVKMFSADPLLYEPGTKYTYSTFGFVLAGLVIEASARQPFAGYLQTHVFAPAGMRDTTVDDVYALIPNRSRGYQTTNTGAVLNAPLLDTSHKIPGGGLVSTASDLVMFALAIGSGKLLQKETVEEMFQPMKTRDGHSTGYGMGWGIGEFAGRRLVSHAGGQSGVSSVLRYLPSEGIALAMMFNLQGVKFEALADQILAIALR
jgi:serine beta-lactamase-like protein LACTB, mitochondrial